MGEVSTIFYICLAFVILGAVMIVVLAFWRGGRDMRDGALASGCLGSTGQVLDRGDPIRDEDSSVSVEAALDSEFGEETSHWEDTLDHRQH